MIHVEITIVYRKKDVCTWSDTEQTWFIEPYKLQK